MTLHSEENIQTAPRTRFAVAMDLRLTIEISAHNEEEAIQLLTNAFDVDNAYDPLFNKQFAITGFPEANPQIKTAVTTEESDANANVWEA